jgi:hypothetical protein
MSVLRLASRRSQRLQCERGVILVAQADECAPEYSNGIPGAFKNGIDWLSQPSRDIEYGK